MRILTLVVLLFFYQLSFSQSIHQTKSFESLKCSQILDSLKLQSSINKTIITEYELVTYIALSYFPELKDTKIKFKSTQIKTTLNARPTVVSLIFRSKTKRKYVIRINNQVKDSVIYFNDVPFNAKIGLIGHEFSHIKDYNQRSFRKVLMRLLSYSNKKSKANFEKKIDLATVQIGLGWQLHDWAKYVLEYSEASVSYKAFKQSTYLTPSDIIKAINDK